jgi:hypothetical protein
MLLRCGEIVFALTLFYLRYCLYETEEGKLENALVDLWIRVSSMADSTRTRCERLLRETARISRGILNRLFGSDLISLKAISVSIALSVSSFYIVEMQADSSSGARHRATIAAVLAVIALAPAVINRRWTTYLAIFSGLAAAAWIGWLIKSTNSPHIRQILSTVVVMSFLVDVMWLIAVREGLTWAARRDGLLPPVAALLLTSAVGLGTFLLLPTFRDNATQDWWADHISNSYMVVWLEFLGSSRLFVAAVSFLQVVVLAISLSHWIIWPFLSRVVYAAARYQSFRERKFFTTIGTAILVHATGGVEWLMEAFKALGIGK